MYFINLLDFILIINSLKLYVKTCDILKHYISQKYFTSLFINVSANYTNIIL